MQRVHMNGISSEWQPIECGVPRVSVLGPPLFLIYRTDLPTVCECTEIFIFANDTNISAVGAADCEIEKNLMTVEKWLHAHKYSKNGSFKP